MKIHLTHLNNKDGTFTSLLFLTVFFILLEISFFILCNSAYLSDFSFISQHLQIPTAILTPIFLFLMAQLLVHISYCIFVWFVAASIIDLFSLPAEKRITFAISLWLLGLLAILTANQYYFPNSKFAELSSIILFNATLTKLILILLSVGCSVAVSLMLIDVIKNTSKILLSAFILSLLSTFFMFAHTNTNFPYDAATNERPNIILIGMDSVRPDFLSFFGGSRKTPFVDSFLEQAMVFSDAVTPLARTFPSWISILMGDYPSHAGVRSNLSKQNKMNLTLTLPAILKANGYETMFATDETRFSNIDKDFGFDHLVSPPMGLNDFLIGTFNDFPMSNLLVNSMVGKWLFPYSYANRPVFFTYDPNSFLKQIDSTLPTKRSKPLFLAVHFCLPHAPYLWSDLAGLQLTAQERYQQSIVRVDQQVADFFALLKQHRLLDHAIVVLLSDHGEALEFSGDRITEKDLYINKNTPVPQFYPPNLANEAINQSAGHGTDVLGLPQYHTLLAFKIYGTEKAQHGIQTSVVSLVDIKPTILDLIGLNVVAPLAANTESLASLITGKRQGVAMLRHIFLESDYSPEAIRTVYPEIEKVLLEGIQLFQVNPRTMRLTVREDRVPMMINSRQYADIYDDWMLALYPLSKTVRMPILINLISGEWTNDLRTPFAQHSPALYMLQALKTFYGSEINNI